MLYRACFSGKFANAITDTSIAMMLVLEQCAMNKKVQYDFPAAMSDYVRADFTKQCDKGRVLYSLNCAKCHNKKYTAGK